MDPKEVTPETAAVPKVKKRSKPKKKAAKRPAKKKVPKRKAAKSKKKAAPKRNTRVHVVARPERLDMRLTKAEKAKIVAKAKRTKRTVTTVVLDAIAKLR